MKLKKIKFLQSPEYKPFSKPSEKIINKDLLNVIKQIEQSVETRDFILSDMKKVAKDFRVNLEFPKLTTTKGLACPKIRTIYVDGDIQSAVEKRAIFCHELAHILQYDLNIWDLRRKYTLSAELRAEQEAEACSILLFKKLFPNLFFNQLFFKKYFNESDILYLYNFCKDSENDLFVWQKR